MARGNLTRWLIGGAAVFAGVFVLAAALLTVRKEHQIPDEISAAAWEKEASEASGPAEERFTPPGGPGDAAHISDMPTYTRWKTFRTTDGLPSDKAFCVRADGERVWVGTDAGLACYSGGRWLTYGVQDGLPYPVVLSLDVSPRTGDLWIGTMGGLARFTGGRFDVFRQTNSGLSNDFVHDVESDPDKDHVWAATAMGASRLNLRTGEWTIFTEQNTPMREPWTYSVAIDRGMVYVGVWGGGVLEYEVGSGRWREYRDPDGEMEMDLLPDDGPVHDVTAAVDYKEGLLWQATYFGVARYDGRDWRTYFGEDSGLASNFVNFVRARGRLAWMATNKGLSVTDGEDWVTYAVWIMGAARSSRTKAAGRDRGRRRPRPSPTIWFSALTFKARRSGSPQPKE